MYVDSYQKLLAVFLICISPFQTVFAVEVSSESVRSESNKSDSVRPASKAVQSGPATTLVTQIKTPRLRIVDATIEAVHQATVSAQIRGRITEISVDVDDYVSKGTVILRFRDNEQRAAVDVAQARFDEADAEYLRKKEVYTKGLVAKSALDKAEASYRAAKANLAQANESLEHTQVRAPYSGIVVKRHVEVGETARIGQKLMTGLSLEKLRAIVELPQSLIHNVRKHKQTWVWVGKNLDRRIKAESLTVSPFADPNSHTFLVRINLPAGEHNVYPGMHTKVAFLAGVKQSLVIPAAAVVKRSEVTGAYVVKDKRITFRYIRLGGMIAGQQQEILSGLSEGETVLLDTDRAVMAIKSQEKSEKE